MRKLILSLYILYLPFQLKIARISIIDSLNPLLLLLFIILIFSFKSDTNNRVKLKFQLPLILFVIFWFLSFMHTFIEPRGLWIWGAGTEFKRLVSLILGYFVFSRCLKDKKEIKFMFYVFLISIVLVAINVARNGTLSGVHFADFKRSSGPFGEDWKGADIAGGFLATFMPFLFSFSLFAKKRLIQVVGFLGFIVCLVGLMTTYARGALVAIAISMLILILFAFKYKKILTGFSKMVLFFVIIFGILGWKLWLPTTIQNRINETHTEDKYGNPTGLDQSSQMRIDNWQNNIYLFKTNPFFGVGFGQTRNYFGVDPHNGLLLIAVEMGVITLLIFLWFIISVFKEALMFAKTEFIEIGAGFVGALVSLVVVNIFYANFFRDTVVGTFWVALGILAAAKRLVVSEKD